MSKRKLEIDTDRGYHLEVGGFSPKKGNAVSHKASTHAFRHPYESPPVVIAGVVSFNGGHPVVPQVLNVTTGEVSMKLDEPACYDDWHLPESADWLAIHSGPHKTDQGVIFEVGKQSIMGPDWNQITFAQEFAVSPVVVPSVNGQPAEWTNLRIKDVNTKGFKIHLEAARKGHKYSASGSVDVSWFAIPQGFGTISGIDYNAQVTKATISNKWTKFTFVNMNNPRIFAGVTHNGGDTANLRLKDQTDGSILLRVDEPEKCGFDEHHPYHESAHLLVFEDTYVEPTQTPTEVPTTLPPTTDEPSFAPTQTPTETPTKKSVLSDTKTALWNQNEANGTIAILDAIKTPKSKTEDDCHAEYSACSLDWWNHMSTDYFACSRAHTKCLDAVADKVADTDPSGLPANLFSSWGRRRLL